MVGCPLLHLAFINHQICNQKQMVYLHLPAHLLRILSSLNTCVAKALVLPSVIRCSVPVDNATIQTMLGEAGQDPFVFAPHVGKPMKILGILWVTLTCLLIPLALVVTDVQIHRLWEAVLMTWKVRTAKVQSLHRTCQCTVYLLVLLIFHLFWKKKY